MIAGDVYWATIGNQSTPPDVDTGFADWFQDFPHPDDFFRPLLNGASILPTNSNNFSRVSIPPELDAKANELRTQQMSDEVKKQYAELDRKYMEQAVWAPTETRSSPPSSRSASTSTRRFRISCSTRTGPRWRSSRWAPLSGTS